MTAGHRWLQGTIQDKKGDLFHSETSDREGWRTKWGGQGAKEEYQPSSHSLASFPRANTAVWDYEVLSSRVIWKLPHGSRAGLLFPYSLLGPVPTWPSVLAYNQESTICHSKYQLSQCYLGHSKLYPGWNRAVFLVNMILYTISKYHWFWNKPLFTLHIIKNYPYTYTWDSCYLDVLLSGLCGSKYRSKSLPLQASSSDLPHVLGFSLLCSSVGQEVCFTPAGATFPFPWGALPSVGFRVPIQKLDRQPNINQSH